MHKKDILGWSKLKLEIEKEEARPNIKVSQIRWCAIGHNIGSEIDGKGDLFARPILILKIISNHTCLCIPLTHSEKVGKHIFALDFKGEKVKLRLDQIRILDLKRIGDKIGELSQNKFEEVKRKTKDFLFN